MDETKFDCHCCVFNRGNYCEADGNCLEGEKHKHEEQTEAFSDVDIFQKAIDTWGREEQTNLAVEEMAELIQAINKTRRYPDSVKARDNLAEEIADVAIMLEQLILIYDCGDEVFTWKGRKIKRIAEHLMKYDCSHKLQLF